MVRFQQILKNWYDQNKRDLPWRNTRNPYFIWLSEIILQQTRVDQGMSYYLKFVSEFPTVFDLARAEEMNVLNFWQGLGYYSRARNLHVTAKTIVEKHMGNFPNTFDEIIKLKGVGNYTASAISSFAFDEPRAVLDGNVFRVLSRVFSIETPIDSTQGQKQFQDLANELLDKKNPAIYNQAIMEFGALQCVPVNPRCDVCPLNLMCESKAQNKVKMLPVKQGKIKITQRWFVFEIIKTKNGNILLEKRNEKGIWHNLFQFPLKEFSNLEDKQNYLTPKNFRFISKEYKHILSHQHLFCTFAYRAEELIDFSDKLFSVSPEELDNYPIPRVVEKFIEENANLLFVK